MKRIGSLALTLGLLASASSAQEIRVGFLHTFTGGGAIFGQEARLAWELALGHLDGKIGGLKVVTTYEDDQQKTDAAVAAADRLLTREKVDVVVGGMWGHTTLAVKDRVLRDSIFIGINAGLSQLAGDECSPYFFQTGPGQGGQVPEAMGILLNKEGLKKVYLIAPNYQGGKDILAGFRRYFKGPIIEENLFKLGTTDFQAELSAIRAKSPDAVFAFAPGNMGVAFMKQWTASGVGQQTKLYTAFVVDHLTLPALGEAAIGTFFTSFWDPDNASPTNQRFVRDFMAKHNKMPSQYAAQVYDAALLLDSAVKKVGGKLDDRKELALALRKADFVSVRGKFKFNVNGFPLQDYYKFDVIKGPAGTPVMKMTGLVVEDHKDAYYTQCKMPF